MSGNASSRTSKIYRNDGNNVFVDINANLIGVSQCDIEWGDYNNDGLLDLLIAGNSRDGRLTRIYKNCGDDIFSPIGANIVNVDSDCSVAWGDFDNDGDSDVLIAGSSSSDGVTKVYRNDGNGNFTDLNLNLPGVHYCSLSWGDYDSDGDLDIAFLGRDNDGDHITKIYRNDNNYVFNDISDGIDGCDGGHVVWGDYNNDGDMDIAITGYGTSTKVYANQEGVFTDIVSGLERGKRIIWGDYDNDGDIDIVVGSSVYHETEIWSNNALNSNTIPNAPSGLSTQLNNGILTLNWNKATDNETGQNGLSYNVRIGTTPNGIDIVSPMSDISNGYRHVVRYGNSFLNNFYIIRDLKPGTYYWSVQTIDNAFAGSAFATEGSFVIPSPVSVNSLLNNSYCVDSEILIPYTTNISFNSGNIFTAQLSDDTGDFSDPYDIGSLQSSSSGTITGSIPADIAEGSGYKLRIVSTNPENNGKEYEYTITINQNPEPQITAGDYYVCAGEITVYGTDEQNGIDFLWTAEGGAILGKSDSNYVEVEWGSTGKGTVTLSQTITETGCENSVSEEVTINPAPTPQIVDGVYEVCLNGIESYKSNVGTEISISWDVIGGIIDGAKNNSTVVVDWNSVGSGQISLMQTNINTGCSATINQEVNVHSVPTPSISGNSFSCKHCTESYYVPTKENLGNLWSVSGGSIISDITDSIITVTWGENSRGKVMLEQKIIGTSCTNYDTLDVTIDDSSLPTISGKNSVCVNNSELYYTSTNTDIDKKWIVENGIIEGNSTSSHVKVFWGNAGIGILKVIHEIKSKNYKDSVSFSIIINEIPEVTLSDFPDVCKNDSPFELTGGKPQGGIYSGTSVTNNIFHPAQCDAENYLISYVYTENGCENTAQNTLTVKPLPEKPVIKKVETFLYCDSPHKFNNFQWYFENTLILGENEYVCEPKKKGTYDLSVWNDNNCRNTSNKIYFDPGTSVKYISNKNWSLSVSPNPVSDKTIVSFSIDTYSQVSLFITNLLGVEVHRILDNENIQKGQHLFDFNANDLPQGVYYCTIKIGDRSGTVKMVIL